MVIRPAFVIGGSGWSLAALGAPAPGYSPGRPPGNPARPGPGAAEDWDPVSFQFPTPAAAVVFLRTGGGPDLRVHGGGNTGEVPSDWGSLPYTGVRAGSSGVRTDPEQEVPVPRPSPRLRGSGRLRLASFSPYPAHRRFPCVLA
ncbi:hypothetical protein GCM10018781_57930 [Kitasatospora indigofera]|uniref:Uncharacterized protein n=1 Tax=Kitasatospora indigofera TaxID=67307 RepID=A0A919L0P9_9ACTN|nr:hypothetical protein GCM10018781_57930 [Kitasatospora indigofera]